MPYRVDLTERASRDLDHIYGAIHADSSERAVIWFNGLEKRINDLERFPEQGPVTRERKSLRQVLYGKKPHIYRIIYSVDHKARIVTVLHIRHGARKAFKRKDIGG
jgi:toxin ParE1/3/4